MAAKAKKTATKKPTTAKSTVTRISATDTKKAAPVKTKAAPKKKSESAEPIKTNAFGRLATPFKAMARYFKGAWFELRQVRWPNRKATWGLTVAVIMFTAFLAVFILLLDALFKYLFELMLG